MRGSKKILLIIYLLIEVVCCGKDPAPDEYKGYPNKRLTNNVIKTMMTSSTFHCITWCSMMEECLAVNVIRNHDITCELTTGLKNESDIQDVYNSELFVLEYNKCAQEPGFCLNNATCEQTWTSARCHCTDLYQGNRCDSCMDMRLQGDGCQECSPRFQGDACQQCAQNYYGENCEYSFTSHPEETCHGNPFDELIADNSGNYDNCKEWCVARNDCGGFILLPDRNRCIFKLADCKNMVHVSSGKVLFLKTFN